VNDNRDLAEQAVQDALAVLLKRIEDLQGAPDGWQRGSKTEIAVTIAPELVDRLDAEAERWHLSRSALLTMWVTERLAEAA
jgi:hypothetical protein